MTARRRSARLGCVIALWGVVALSHAAEGAEPPVSAPSSPGAAAGLERKLGAQLPLATKFQASDGREVALGDVLGNGKPGVLVLAYNSCTMLCSLVLRSVTELVRDFPLRPGEQFSLVTISIDPRDSVFEASRLQAALLDSAGFPGQVERWAFLVGKKPSIDAVASQLGFRYAWDEATRQYAHPAVIFAISPGGAVTGYFDGLRPDREELLAVLAGNRPGGFAGGLEDAILNCFRFDTANSRYGPAIAWFLRAGAASVGLSLLFLLAWLVHRDRMRHAKEQS